MLMRPHKVPVEREESTDEMHDLGDVHMDALKLVEDGLGSTEIKLGRRVHQAELGIKIGLLLRVRQFVPREAPVSQAPSSEVKLFKGEPYHALRCLGLLQDWRGVTLE